MKVTIVAMAVTTLVQSLEDDWVLISRPPAVKPLTTIHPQRRELEWLLNELHETLKTLKSGLEECYALLAPVEPGSTLVVSTPRNEIVKGHITRQGTRIVKGVCLLPPFPFPSTTGFHGSTPLLRVVSPISS